MALSIIKKQAQAIAAAFQFLTRIPVPVNVPFERSILSLSAVYFPVAGAAIGVIAALWSWLLLQFLPSGPAAALGLAGWLALSGGLHMDGWMDTADGVLSHRSREKMLEIMKDSRVGAMGVLAAVLLLFLKISILTELPAASEHSMNGDNAALIAAILLSSIWSRTWMTIAMAFWRPATPESGLGRLFSGVNYSKALMAAIIAVISSLTSLMIIGINIKETILITAPCAVAALAVGGTMAVWLNRKLGGLTGDTYGAMNEAVEAAVLLVMLLLLL
ncbi:adenosylcobinamide-GDP ribazoletransferase [Paenibacillus sp. CAU 1782]